MRGAFLRKGLIQHSGSLKRMPKVNSSFHCKTWEVNSCLDRQLRHKADSAVLLALDAKVLRQSPKPDFECKGKRAGRGKTGFVGEYNRSSVFNFGEISGTLRVDSRIYLSYCRSRSGLVPRDGIRLGTKFERSSHLGKPKIFRIYMAVEAFLGVIDGYHI